MLAFQQVKDVHTTFGNDGKQDSSASRLKQLLETYWPLFVVLAGGLLVYCIAATKSSLWYDEAIEYYYSKYLVGEVPGGFGTQNMYERITQTFQPPLYNVLMFFWLSAFDGEFAFRLAGILTMLIGAVGIYLAIHKEIDGGKALPAAGTAAYLLSSAGAYYALECAEYNLMMCNLAWSLYFLVAFLHEEKPRHMYLFFIFCCLSIYSMYGAAFAVFGMALVMLSQLVWTKNWKMLTRFFLTANLCVVLAGLPLLFLFLLPQLSLQGTVAIEHALVLKHSNLLVDYIASLWSCLRWLFSAYSLKKFQYHILAIVVVSCLATLVCLCKSRTTRRLFVAFFLAFTLYYILVAFSYYAYTNYDGRGLLGTNNMAKRYCLFMLPFLVVLFTSGWHAVFALLREKSPTSHHIAQVLAVGVFILFASAQIYKIDAKGWTKSSIRELVAIWYDSGYHENRTLVHRRHDANFHFYLTHDERYDTSVEDVITIDYQRFLRADADTMQAELSNMGFFDGSSFYCVLPAEDKWNTSAFFEVVEAEGYQVTYLFDESSAKLLLCEPAN